VVSSTHLFARTFRVKRIYTRTPLLYQRKSEISGIFIYFNSLQDTTNTGTGIANTFAEVPQPRLCAPAHTSREKEEMNRITADLKLSCFLGVALALFLGVANSATALPGLMLDLDASNVSYNGTIQTTDDTFSVYAYLAPKNSESLTDVNNLLADTYYVSIALTPQTGPTGGTFGSFDVDTTTVTVTGDMTYGAPPLNDPSPLWESGDLQKHGIFETFYYEVAFQFDASDVTLAYDTQTTRFADGFDDSVTQLFCEQNIGDCMYFVELEIDKTMLNNALQLHFDLYNTELRDCTRNPNCDPNDLIIGGAPYDFAPFSHDAETIVPEPNGLMLFAAGLLVVGYTLRRQG
jgi:hypothetical protein